MHLIESGLLGKAYTATLETHWRREAAYYATPWRGTWAGECGGVIVSHAIHIHDLMAHALGGVKRVAAFLQTRCNPIETEDCAAVSLETGSGALVTSSMTLGAAEDMSRMRFCFENATIQSDLEPYTISQGNWTFVAKTPELQREIDAACAAVDDGYSRYAGLYEAVHRALHGEDVPLLGDIAAARHAMELITAIYDSQRNERIVSLPLDGAHSLYRGWVPETASPARAASH
nr:Gfo/Idh/MocA family oxidoreductase [Pelagibacterium xiamenense]